MESPVALLTDAIRQGFQINMQQPERIAISTNDLWKFICLLFLIDEAEGKLGMCENPDCPAPYFKRKRRTQRFCERGSCTAYAARLYTQRWWETKGRKERHDKRAKARKNKKRKKR